MQKYMAQMTWNTKLFQQVAKFEQLNIGSISSVLEDETRGGLALQLAEEAVAVRFLLLKARFALLTRIFSEKELTAYAIRKLRALMQEYKRLELDALALFSMGTSVRDV